MISKGGGLDSVVAVPEILAGTPEVSVDLFATLISTNPKWLKKTEETP